jgi:hypothetical protein
MLAAGTVLGPYKTPALHPEASRDLHEVASGPREGCHGECPTGGADGQRLFSPAFKREPVARLVRGEVTISELSRELGISRSVLQR